MVYAHHRWTIEQFHRETKQFLGINEFEGRTWGGWHHHVTIVLLAYAFLSPERARRDHSAEPGLPPLSTLATRVRRELCIQDLMDEQGMDRDSTEDAASTMLRVVFGET